MTEIEKVNFWIELGREIFNVKSKHEYLLDLMYFKFNKTHKIINCVNMHSLLSSLRSLLDDLLCEDFILSDKYPRNYKLGSGMDSCYIIQLFYNHPNWKDETQHENVGLPNTKRITREHHRLFNVFLYDFEGFVDKIMVSNKLEKIDNKWAYNQLLKVCKKIKRKIDRLRQHLTDLPHE
jgi:hypothetical protein